MIWLASQMWLILAVAFGLGAGLGWWIRGAPDLPRARSTDAGKVGKDQPGELRRQSVEKAPLNPVSAEVSASPRPAAAVGPAEDLTQIIGLDATTQTRLHAVGVTTLAQIAQLTDESTRWLDGQLGDEGRIDREGWIGQARNLLQGEA
ncbi:MAG: hypothetical protein AAFY84_06760 [Pseudomonadota bacterium]